MSPTIKRTKATIARDRAARRKHDLRDGLPAGVIGHFGPELRRFVLAQHHQGQVTVPRLVAQLRGIGVAISKRQTMRLLIAGQDGFRSNIAPLSGTPRWEDHRQ
jgi:hypothetical protein